MHLPHPIPPKSRDSQNLSIKSFTKNGEIPNCMEMTEKLLVCLVS